MIQEKKKRIIIKSHTARRDLEISAIGILVWKIKDLGLLVCFKEKYLGFEPLTQKKKKVARSIQVSSKEKGKKKAENMIICSTKNRDNWGLESS